MYTSDMKMQDFGSLVSDFSTFLLKATSSYFLWFVKPQLVTFSGHPEREHSLCSETPVSEALGRLRGEWGAGGQADGRKPSRHCGTLSAPTTCRPSEHVSRAFQ